MTTESQKEAGSWKSVTGVMAMANKRGIRKINLGHGKPARPSSRRPEIGVPKEREPFL